MSWPWIPFRMDQPTARDIVVRSCTRNSNSSDSNISSNISSSNISSSNSNSTLLPSLAVSWQLEEYAVVWQAASSPRERAVVADAALQALVQRHYRFVLSTTAAATAAGPMHPPPQYRLVETAADWTRIRQWLAVVLATLPVVGVPRASDLVVACSTNALDSRTNVLAKIVTLYGKDIAAVGTEEERAQVLVRIATQAATCFGCRFLLARRSSRSTVFYRVLDPVCDKAQQFLSRAFIDAAHDASFTKSNLASLNDTLLMLDPATRLFLAAHNIQTTVALLKQTTEEIVKDLMEWRRRNHMKEWKESTAKIYVNRWKRMAAKQQNGANGQQQSPDDSNGLTMRQQSRHPDVVINLSLVLLDPIAKTFLADYGITTSVLLFQTAAEDLGESFIDWRRQKNLTTVTVSDAKQYVYAWRRCVSNYGQSARLGTVTTSALSGRVQQPFQMEGDRAGLPIQGCDGTVSHENALSLASPMKVSAKQEGVSYQSRQPGRWLPQKVVYLQRPSSETESARTTVSDGILESTPSPTADTLHTLGRLDHVTDARRALNPTVAHIGTSVSTAGPRAAPATSPQQVAARVLDAKVGDDDMVPPALSPEEELASELTAAPPTPTSAPMPTTDGTSPSTESLLPGADEILASLDPTVLSFIFAEGITSASNFCARSTEELSKAFAAWRLQRGMKTLLAGSIERYIQLWKQSVRRQLDDIPSQDEDIELSNGGLHANETDEVADKAVVPEVNTQPIYSGDEFGQVPAVNQVSNLTVNLQLNAELASQEQTQLDFDPSFDVFSRTVRSFLASQAIATPADFFLRSTHELSKALVDWRKAKKFKEVKLRTAEQYIQRWRRSVAAPAPGTTEAATMLLRLESIRPAAATLQHSDRSALSPLHKNQNFIHPFFGDSNDDLKATRRSSLGPVDNTVTTGRENQVETIGGGEAPSLNLPNAGNSLDVLDVSTKAFLASRGITTVQALLQSTSESLANALVAWRRQEKVKQWTFSTAQRYVWKWKQSVKQKRSADGEVVKTRPSGRPPMACTWDASRGVWVPKSGIGTSKEGHVHGTMQMESTKNIEERKATSGDDMAGILPKGYSVRNNVASAAFIDVSDEAQRSGLVRRKVAKRTFMFPKELAGEIESPADQNHANKRPRIEEDN